LNIPDLVSFQFAADGTLRSAGPLPAEFLDSVRQAPPVNSTSYRPAPSLVVIADQYDAVAAHEA